MKINRIGNWVKSNIRGRQQYYLDLRNPSLQAVRLNGRIAPYGGGKPITPKEAAALFEKAGLHDLAKAVSPETSVEELLELVKQNRVNTIEVELAKNLRSRELKETELVQLVKIPLWKVREIAAESSVTPVEALFELIADENDCYDVVRKAISNLRSRKVDEAEINKAAAKSPFEQVRCAVAKSITTSIEVLFELANDENVDVSRAAIETLRFRGY